MLTILLYYKRLSTVTFSDKDIGKIIQNLDLNKARGHNNISIHKLQICDDSICVLLEIIFKQALLTSVFPSEWKKRNIVSIHKKRDNQNTKNYRTFFSLPICGKIFEILKFNKMFPYSPLNSSLKTSLVSNPVITHENFISFDNGLEVRSVFLGISKAFDKVCHEWLIFKLKKNKKNDTSGDILHILSDFLSNRK